MEQNITPDTTAYLILGLTVTALVMGALIARIMIGFRNAHRDEAALKEIEG